MSSSARVFKLAALRDIKEIVDDLGFTPESADEVKAKCQLLRDLTIDVEDWALKELESSI